MICTFIMPMYVTGLALSRGFLGVELGLNSVWLVFWLAAASSLADLVRDLNDISGGPGLDDYLDEPRRRVGAACAFAWFTFFLWGASTLISFKQFRGAAAQSYDNTTSRPGAQPVGSTNPLYNHSVPVAVPVSVGPRYVSMPAPQEPVPQVQYAVPIPGYALPIQGVGVGQPIPL